MKHASDPRKRELARIHILAEQLGLDRDTYEDMLWVQARVRSAAALDDHGRRAVIKHMDNLLQRGRPALGGTQPRALTRRPLLRKIEAQLRASGRDWNYAAAMASRMYVKDTIDFCSDQELVGIVTALAIDAKRRAGP